MNMPLKLPKPVSKSGIHFPSTPAVEQFAFCLAPTFNLDETATENPLLLASKVMKTLSSNAPLPKIVFLIGDDNRVPDANAPEPHAEQGSNRHALVASLVLNDPSVREQLLEFDIVIPSETLFVAVCHDSTTSRVDLVRPFFAPSTHRREIMTVLGWLQASDDDVRRSRIESLFGGSCSSERFSYRSAC